MKTLIINYKAYREGIDKGTEIALASKEIADGLGVDIIVAVPFTFCRGAAKITKAISQGLDPIEPGASTGHVSWYEISKSGCIGSLINHAENRVPMVDVAKTIAICKANSLLSYVCVADLDEAGVVANMNPTAISYEPKEFIGAAMKEGGASVATAKGEVVKDFVDLVHSKSSSIALIGAGIKDSADARKSVELGSDGLMVSSIVMKGNFREKIAELAEGLVS